ncbi:MAG: phosphotransferase [Chloroflexota bacterium]|nr:aminoglycoside phosphotransferase family protein [Dehalococcoidia bacterium]MDW8253816.1 phosphotransferase [Chloroflexota bacterium]
MTLTFPHQPATLPAKLLEAAAHCLGAPILAVEPLQGGYSAQSHRRLTLADGRRVVLKAAPPAPVSGLPGRLWSDLLGREIWVYQHVPETQEWRPRSYGAVAGDGWRGLLLEDLSSCRRVPPWSAAAIDAVAAALARLHAIPQPAGMPPDLIGRLGPQRFWGDLRARGRASGHLPTGYTTSAWWAWFDRALPLAERAYARLATAPLRRAFNHNDVRSDNLFFCAERPIFLDWGQAIWDTPARDSVYWALGVERETGIPAPAVHERYLAHAPHPGADAVRGVLAFWVGYFVDKLQAGGVVTDNQRLRAEFLGPTVRWFAMAFDLPLPPEGEAQ